MAGVGNGDCQRGRGATTDRREFTAFRSNHFTPLGFNVGMTIRAEKDPNVFTQIIEWADTVHKNDWRQMR